MLCDSYKTYDALDPVSFKKYFTLHGSVGQNACIEVRTPKRGGHGKQKVA